MSTMYYTASEKKPLGQIHFKGKGKGYHFTWTILPLAYARFRTESALIVDEYSGVFSMRAFEDIVDEATSQSYEEGLE